MGPSAHNPAGTQRRGRRLKPRLEASRATQPAAAGWDRVVLLVAQIDADYRTIFYDAALHSRPAAK